MTPAKDDGRTPRTALLIVDVQEDFCPGGALAVARGDRVAASLSAHIQEAADQGWPIFASRDWHPSVTKHFERYGGEWPAHCVQGTAGARFHPALQLPESAIVITKGDEPDRPGYSAFDGHTNDGAPFGDTLRDQGIDHLVVGGLATDYCVKHSVLDALKAGLKVTLLLDAVAGVDLKPGDSEHAIREMHEAGAQLGGERLR